MTKPFSPLPVAVAAWGSLVGLVLLAGALVAMTGTLSGCVGGFSAAPTVASKQMVYSAESDFTVALRVAVAYEALPACSSTQPFPCSDPKTVAVVTAAAKAARSSLATAEVAVRSSTNAQAMTNAALQAEADVATFKALAAALQ